MSRFLTLMSTRAATTATMPKIAATRKPWLEPCDCTAWKASSAAWSAYAADDAGLPVCELASSSWRWCCDAPASEPICDLPSLLDALANAVASTARPIEPPTCWPTLSSADARPVSVSVTLVTATTVSVTNSIAMPAAISTIAGRTPVQYVLAASTRANRNRPTVITAEPAVIRNLGPTRGRTWLTMPEPTMMIALYGRYATPDLSELKPNTPWMKNVR